MKAQSKRHIHELFWIYYKCILKMGVGGGTENNFKNEYLKIRVFKLVGWFHNIFCYILKDLFNTIPLDGVGSNYVSLH